MKNLLQALAMTLTTTWGTTALSTTNDPAPRAPQFSCTQESTTADNYKLAIDVYQSTMNIFQSSNSARYAPLHFSITKDDSLPMTRQLPKFSCSAVYATADNYSIKISVFEDSLFIYQASNTARFEVLKYRIAAKSRVFRHDGRLADGALKELAIVNAGVRYDVYDVTLRTAFFDFSTGQEVDYTKTLGSNLSCQFAADAIVCQRDDRPVDGTLTKVILSYDRDNREWSASLHKALFDRVSGQEVKETKQIASRLIEQK